MKINRQLNRSGLEPIRKPVGAMIADEFRTGQGGAMKYALVSESFDESNLHFYARLKFNPGAARSGTFNLAADQWAMAWLNGHFLGRTFVHAHADECRYQTFQLDAHLQPGENVLAVLLHSWSRPTTEIPGVPPLMPIVFACSGNAGATDLGNLTAWRVAPALEYRPAPRHNDLIGHEEARDMRLEPLGWREPGFDDSAWKAPVTRPLEGRRFLPSPLRPLKEETVFPSRIVAQGAPEKVAKAKGSHTGLFLKQLLR